MGSVAVGDVPACTLSTELLIVLGGEGRIAEVPVADLLAMAFLCTDLCSVVCQDRGEVWCVVHMAMVEDLAGFGKGCGLFAEWLGGSWGDCQGCRSLIEWLGAGSVAR